MSGHDTYRKGDKRGMTAKERTAKIKEIDVRM
jgi:hypothetical protein